MKVEDVYCWEKNNKININMFGYDEDAKKVYAIRLCDGNTSIVLDEERENKFINLFLHDDNHFCVVKDISR